MRDRMGNTTDTITSAVVIKAGTLAVVAADFEAMVEGYYRVLTTEVFIRLEGSWENEINSVKRITYKNLECCF